VAVASCLVAGSGGVAVAGDCRRWQCGHFEWWQVENPFSGGWQWLVAVRVAVAGWQWDDWIIEWVIASILEVAS
jgi:hypothetical protein